MKHLKFLKRGLGKNLLQKDSPRRHPQTQFALDDYATRLYLSDFLRESLVREIIGTLELPRGSSGLDLGCGIGSNTILLAEAVGEGGRMTGVDRSADLLTLARRRAAYLGERTVFYQKDMNRLDFAERSFDWAWSMDCAGYAPGDPVTLLKDLARIVRPGGAVYLLAWSSQQLLPGHPRLEAKLNATAAGLAPFVDEGPPESHFLRAAGWFRTAGFNDCRGRTFTGDIQAPLDEETRRALLSLLEMRWGTSEIELSKADRMEYNRLCRPDSPECIVDCPDYYGFFTYTLFQGLVAD